MLRSGAHFFAAAVVAVFLLFPSDARAQQAEDPERTHTVAPGETLAQIAREHLGSAGEWRRIYEANQDRLENPDRLQEGMELVIPAREAERERRVLGVEVRPEGAGEPAVRPEVDDTVPQAPGERRVLDAVHEQERGERHRERQAMAEFSTFQPQSPGPFSGDRSIFYRDPAMTQEAMRIEAWSPDARPAVPSEVLRVAGWLLDAGEELEAVGQVSAFAGEQDLRGGRTAIQNRDLLRGTFFAESLPEAGERFLVVRVDRELNDGRTVVIPTGRVEVRRITSGGAVLRVVRGYDRMELGEYLVPDRETPLEPGVEPEPAGEDLEARVIAFEREKELFLRNDRAFLDVGRAHGVRIGDEFVVTLGEEEGWEGREVARFQVVNVGEDTSTVRLRSTISREVQSGVTARLDRRVP